MEIDVPEEDVVLDGQASATSKKTSDSKVILLLMKKGHDHYSKKNYDQAIYIFNEIIRAHPKYTDCRYSLANALREKGSYDEARSEYVRVLMVKPGADIYNDLGICYDHEVEYNSAVRAFVNAIRMKKSPHYKKNLIDVLEKLGLPSAEINEFIRQIPRFSSIADAHVSLGDLLYRRSCVDDAMGQYREAIELKRDHVMAHNGLGTCHYAKKDYASAIDEYGTALLIQPDFANGYNNLANTYYCLNRIDEAIKEYIECIYRSPRNGNAHYYLGKCYYKKGRVDEAVMEYRKASAFHRSNAEFYYDLGRALGDKGLFNDAIKEYKKAIKIKPDYDDALAEISRLLQQNVMPGK